MGVMQSYQNNKLFFFFKYFLVVWTLYIGVLGSLVHFRVNGDGVSYLEIAKFYASGDFISAINAYWSPLYSWILALFLAIFRPLPSQEYFLVEIANLFIFCFTFFCFRFFLINIKKFRQFHGICLGKTGNYNKNILDILGICLFAWMVIEWIPVFYVTPDLCVAAFVFLAAGQLLKIVINQTGKIKGPFLFGMILAGGYLAKAAMFPLSFIFFIVSLFIGGNRRQIFRRSFLTLAGFCLLALPWILILSFTKGRITYSDAGTLNYAWYVIGGPNRNWQGEGDAGSPIHATRMLNERPPVFEFASPVPGTYPTWFDPSYWNEGMEVKFDFRSQLQQLRENLLKYINFGWRFSVGWTFPLCLLILWAICSKPHRLIRNILVFWPILAFSVAAFGIYALVHVELRFLGAFAVLIFLSFFAGMEPTDGQVGRRGLSIVLLLALFAGPFRVPYIDQEFIPDSKAILKGQVQIDPYRELADLLMANGIRPGQKIAVIGANAAPAVWAHRARVKIIAEVPSQNRLQFWDADDESRRQVFEIFSKLNVAAVMAYRPPKNKSLDKKGWIMVESASKDSLRAGRMYFYPMAK